MLDMFIGVTSLVMSVILYVGYRFGSRHPKLKYVDFSKILSKEPKRW